MVMMMITFYHGHGSDLLQGKGGQHGAMKEKKSVSML
jgi:hypothetical protein